MNTDQLLSDGIAAVEAGDLDRAQALLAQVVQQDPGSEPGWYWLGQCLAHPEQRAYCFRRVLAINPENEDARQRLAEATGSQAAASATAAPAPDSAPRPRRALRLDRNIALGAIVFLVGIGLFGIPLAFLVIWGLPGRPAAPLAALPTAVTEAATEPPPTTSPESAPASTASLAPATAAPEETSSAATPAPTTDPALPATPEGAQAVNLASGTGPAVIPPNGVLVYRFDPGENLSLQGVEALTFHLISTRPSDMLDMQLYLWDPSEDNWGIADLTWGANQIEFPEDFVTAAGQIYVEIRNWSSQEVRADNMGFTLIARRADGTVAVLGLSIP